MLGLALLKEGEYIQIIRDMDNYTLYWKENNIINMIDWYKGNNYNKVNNYNEEMIILINNVLENNKLIRIIQRLKKIYYKYMDKNVYINGPISVYRLVNNNKIIYLFSDLHYNDTECMDLNAIDIHKYFMKSLGLEKSLDFFIEKPNSKFSSVSLINKRKTTYIEKVRGISDLFTDKKNELVKNFKNKRFHYFDDIRQHDPILYEIQIDINTNNINEVIKFYNIIKIYNNIFNPKDKFIKKITKTRDKKLGEFLENRLNKIKNLFEDIKGPTLKFMDNIIKKYDKREYMKKDFVIDLIELNNKLEKLFVLIRSVVDLYLFRRIMDKDYVETAIVYGGLFHILHLIDLFKNYGFEITHKTCEIPKYDFNILLEKEDEIIFNIIKRDMHLFETYQCVNIGNFPENFE